MVESAVPFAILALVALPFAVDQLRHELELFQTLLSAFNRRYRTRRLAIDIVFRTPEAPRATAR